jgi:signal transduction histidine kinase
MRLNSLAVRLITAATLWSAAALVVAGLILTSLYRQTVVGAFDERLNVYLRTLVGSLAAQDSGGGLSDPGNLGEQRFELLYSGWYWQVREADNGPVVLASRSLFSDVLDIAKLTDRHESGGLTAGALTGPDEQALRVLGRTITFADGHTFDILVAGDAGVIQDQIASFRTSVILTLAVFGVGLVLATTIQIRWGLRPLERVRRGLAELRSGRQARFEGSLPAEIEPLVKELNALLESNQEVIDRARTQVGNLAHALKTPLSVVINEARAARGPLAAKVAEQAALMHRQISHHLDRARIAARVNVIGAVTEVEPVVARLVRAMRRIHGDRGVTLTCHIPDHARFKGEQQDFEEIVGNLVDNACKWAKSAASVTVEYQQPIGEGDLGRLSMFIDDDGPGLSAEEIEAATARGHRLDETKPGSGLGLSIVADLVSMYRGKLDFGRSPAGGLRVVVELPAA